MRHFHGMFNSIIDLKVKILEEFEEFVPSNLSFSVGYFDGKQSSKHWLYSQEDLKAMYDAHASNPEKDIRLWCDGKRDIENNDERPLKRKKSSTTPREEREDKVDDLVKELKDKNSAVYDFSDAQYYLWARMIVTGMHSSKDTPPQVPMITGTSSSRKGKSVEKETVISTAASIVKAVANVSNTQIVHSPNSSCQSVSPVHRQLPPMGVSPGRAVEIRGKSLTQLSTIKQLYEENVLTEEEYEEQKKIILSGLRKL